MECTQYVVKIYNRCGKCGKRYVNCTLQGQLKDAVDVSLAGRAL